MMFMVFLIGLGFLPYSKTILKMGEEVSDIGIKKALLPLIIWVVLAAWILYAAFM